MEGQVLKEQERRTGSVYVCVWVFWGGGEEILDSVAREGLLIKIGYVLL